jgi:hypothetical protein
MVAADLLRAISQTQPTAAMLVAAETVEAEETLFQAPVETVAMQVVLALPEMPDLQPVAATEPTAAMAVTAATAATAAAVVFQASMAMVATAERQATAH